MKTTVQTTEFCKRRSKSAFPYTLKKVASPTADEGNLHSSSSQIGSDVTKQFPRATVFLF
jgi:hypothetical protein